MPMPKSTFLNKALCWGLKEWGQRLSAFWYQPSTKFGNLWFLHGHGFCLYTMTCFVILINSPCITNMLVISSKPKPLYLPSSPPSYDPNPVFLAQHHQRCWFGSAGQLKNKDHRQTSELIVLEPLDFTYLTADRMVNAMMLIWWRYLTKLQCKVNLPLEGYQLTEYN